MIPFQRLDLADRQRVYDLFNRTGRQGCEYSFVNLFLWGRQNAAWMDGYLAVFSHYFGHSMYLYPAGEGDIRPVLDALREDARKRGIPFRLTALSEADRQVVEGLYPGQFKFIPDRDGYDYLYEIDHLADLKGKRYQQKRNHINRFLENCPDWHAEILTPALFPSCQALLEKWYDLHIQADPHMDYHMEQMALSRAFRYFEELGMDGMVLYNGDEPIGFTMGSRLSDTVYDVHFEKAFDHIHGDYAMVNRTFARHIREKYPEIRYLNREDDMGLPGLRKAKESYHPDRMVEQYCCVMRGDPDDV